MKKIIIFTLLFVFMVVLVGCMGKEKGQLTRVDAQKMNPDGNYGDVVMITDNKSIELLRTAFEEVKWEPNVVVNMARKADVKATLFFEFDENMPERLYEYEIWFVENSGTVNIVSNNEKEGYGELDKDKAGILKIELINKITNWEVRNEYEENDKVLFSIYPDPALAAGKPYGYIFNFTEPFETFKGKNIAIYAYHKETGKRVTAFSPKTITEHIVPWCLSCWKQEPSSSLERFTMNFELPHSGLWRYEVVLNDQIYGDVILSVNESSS